VDNQALIQNAVRNITGSALAYNGDWNALFDANSIPNGGWSGRLLAWINSRLGTSISDINGAMVAYAANRGFARWDDMPTLQNQYGIWTTDAVGATADCTLRTADNGLMTTDAGAYTADSSRLKTDRA